jgi:DNA-binding MarR family transcriptional regulator
MQMKSDQLLILTALANNPGSTGPQLCKITGLSIGKFYPAIYGLEDDNKVTSEWADMPRPRHREYRLVG